MPINAKDGRVVHSSLAQENNDPTAIKNLISIGWVAYFAVPPEGNKLAMSASSDTLEASICAQRVTKEGDVAWSPSPLVNNKRLANKYFWKCSSQHSICRGNVNGGALSMANIVPTCQPFHFYEHRRRGNVAIVRSWNMGIEASNTSPEALIATWYMQWGCDGEHFTHSKQSTYLPIFSLLYKRGSWGNFALFWTWNVGIEASSTLLEVLIATWCMQWWCNKEHFTHGNQSTCLPIFSFSGAQRATRQRCPLLKLKREDWCFQRIARSADYNLVYALGMQRGPLYPQQTNYLFAGILLVINGEGDDATLPSFAIPNALVEASSTSLKALIATGYMQWGCDGEHFNHNKQSTYL